MFKAIFNRGSLNIWVIAFLASLGTDGTVRSALYVMDNFTVESRNKTLESDLRYPTPTFASEVPVGARYAPCDSILESITATSSGAECFWLPRKSAPLRGPS